MRQCHSHLLYCNKSLIPERKQQYQQNALLRFSIVQLFRNLTRKNCGHFSYRYGSSYDLIKCHTVCTKLTSVFVHAKTCLALQVKSPSSLSTDRSQTDVVKKSRAFKFGSPRIRLRNNFSYQRNGARRINSAVIRKKVVPNSSQMD
jgi:hypothetical protein